MVNNVQLMILNSDSNYIKLIITHITYCIWLSRYSYVLRSSCRLSWPFSADHTKSAWPIFFMLMTIDLVVHVLENLPNFWSHSNLLSYQPNVCSAFLVLKRQLALIITTSADAATSLRGVKSNCFSWQASSPSKKPASW